MRKREFTYNSTFADRVFRNLNQAIAQGLSVNANRRGTTTLPLKREFSGRNAVEVTLKDKYCLGELLNWFDGVDCTVKHESTRELRQRTTGEWVFKEQLYIDWRKLSAKFLWLGGKGGFGRHGKMESCH
jgi:hypothetical protein